MPKFVELWVYLSATQLFGLTATQVAYVLARAVCGCRSLRRFGVGAAGGAGFAVDAASLSAAVRRAVWRWLAAMAVPVKGFLRRVWRVRRRPSRPRPKV